MFYNDNFPENCLYDVKTLTFVNQCGKKLDESSHPAEQMTVFFHSKIIQKQITITRLK